MIDPSISACHVGDCRELLAQLPDGCVQTCCTSPPYWGLRDYGVDGQLGLEATPAEYVANLVQVFAAVRRVLRDDGTLWLNLGDCYVTNPRGPGGAELSTLTGTPDPDRSRQRWEAAGKAGRPTFDAVRQQQVRALAHPRNRTTDPKVKGRSHSVAVARGLVDPILKHKDMVGIPWRVAFALQEDGWYLRGDIIWAKPNPMPESVQDRPTKSHEYLFLLSKSATYFYDAAAIAEQAVESASYNKERRARADFGGAPDTGNHQAFGVPWVGSTRNKRDVWTIATQPYAEAHFATMPPDLVKPCVLAGSRPGDLVLDPFFGSGTTGMVAETLGRRWIGFELNAEYVKLSKERTAQTGMVLR